MSDIEIVGISGNAGSGKDWIAKNILYPLGYRQWSFAWHFKVFLAGQGVITYEEAFHTKPPHVRKLLQEEGTERGRMVYGEEIWVDAMYNWFRTIAEHWGESRFVIPDVRFPNEVEGIQRLGGKVYRIIAPNRISNSGLSEDARQHPSETALNDYINFNGFIYNDPEYASTVTEQVYGLLNIN